MHPLTAIALVHRINFSQRIASATNISDADLALGNIAFEDVDDVLAESAKKAFFGYPELPIKKQQIAIYSAEFSRGGLPNDDPLEEWSGDAVIEIMDPRALRCLVIAEAIRRDFNKIGRTWPIPGDFGAGPTIVNLFKFKLVRIGGTIPPDVDEGYEVFRQQCGTSIIEQLEEE